MPVSIKERLRGMRWNNLKVEQILDAPRTLGLKIQEFIEDADLLMDNPDIKAQLDNYLTPQQYDSLWLAVQQMESVFVTLLALAKDLEVVDPDAVDFRHYDQGGRQGPAYSTWLEVYANWNGRTGSPSIPPGWEPPEDWEPPAGWPGPPPGWSPQTGYNWGEGRGVPAAPTKRVR